MHLELGTATQGLTKGEVSPDVACVQNDLGAALDKEPSWSAWYTWCAHIEDPGQWFASSRVIETSSPMSKTLVSPGFNVTCHCQVGPKSSSRCSPLPCGRTGPHTSAS